MRVRATVKFILGLILSIITAVTPQAAFTAQAQSVCTSTPDFTNLNSPCVTCTYGQYWQSLSPPYNIAFGSPFQDTGIINSRHTVISQPGYDPNTGNKLPVIPAGETKSVRLGNSNINAEAEAITYNLKVQPNSSLMQIKFAVVMQDPGHPHDEQPRFVIKILNDKDSLVETCAEYDISAAAYIPGFQTYTGLGTPVRWRPWTTIAIDLSSYIGQNIKVQFINYDCLQGGHFGYAYYTAECLPSKLNLTACASDKVKLEAPPFCESYLWTNGDTASSTTYLMPGNNILSASCLIHSVTGCEFTLNAYITPSPHTKDTTIYDTICEGESYNKNYFDLPPHFRLGTHSHVNEFYDINTCSRKATAYLQLTVKQKYFYINDMTCQALDYVKYGFSHLNPAPGIIRDTLKYLRADGCDSIVCLNLTVSRNILTIPASITGNPKPCIGETQIYTIPGAENFINFTWTVPASVEIRGAANGDANTANGTAGGNANTAGGSTNSNANGVANSAVIALQFTDKSTPDILKVYAANGCGGTEVTLFVEPASSHYLSFIDSVCSGLEYKKNGFDIPRRDSAGFEIFTQRYQTQNGCDSIRNLYLNIYPTPDVTVKSSTDVICSDDSVQLEVTYANYEAPEELYEVKVGDILCEGDTVVAVEDFAASGKSAMGIVFWVSPDKTHGWAVGLAVKNTGTVWSAATRYVFVPNVTNFSANTAANISYFDTAGYKNTKAIRAFGNASEFPAAWAVDFDNGWFLPAITQVRVLFGNMELIKPSFIVAGASIGTTTNLWSSSQSGSTHAMAVGNTGYISSDNRYFTFAVRQIRYFSTGKK